MLKIIQVRYRAIDRKCNGYFHISLLIILEIVVVYSISNLPFIIAAMGADNDFVPEYISILSSQISDGALFVFVCAFIAPVLHWALVESKKVGGIKFVFFSTLIVLMFTLLNFAGKEPLAIFEDITIYCLALFVWVVHLLFKFFPPERRSFEEIAESGVNEFLEATSAEKVAKL